MLVSEIQRYVDFVRSGTVPCCKEQHQLCDYVEQAFGNEHLRVDTEQLAKYLTYQKYFPFTLFDWEVFCFALHNCTYREDGRLRWPVLVIFVGRGAGKNGFLGFEDFCLLTPTNGVPEYDTYIFATSERQAKTSFDDVYNVLTRQEKKMRRHFRWTKEEIENLQTHSKLYFQTSSPKTKDGQRPGKVDFDEYHAYESYKLIEVGKTGLGKKAHPRQTIISTNGDIRGGPLDDLVEKCERILDGEEPDNGTLPFICRLDDEKEVDDPRMWNKPNPSLRFLPDLLYEMEIEYGDFKSNPAANTSFMTKRMNRPPRVRENEVTSWENILATNQDIDESLLVGQNCVAGFDFMKTTDFLGAGLLFRVDGKDYWITHTWVCSESPDLGRIKAPLRDWEAQGLLTFVTAPQIPAELPVEWVVNEAKKRSATILRVGMDDYRASLMRNALRAYYFSDEKGFENLIRIRPSDEMKRVPLITSGFVDHRYVWGDNPLMRWATWNSKTMVSQAGNITYGKIEPKSRKTDPFKAFVAAECVSDVLDMNGAMQDLDAFDVFTC